MGNSGTHTEPEKNQSHHSNVRKGLTDYGDGANTTHYLGNDDYKDGTNLPDDNADHLQELSGREAGGNLDMNEEDLSSERDKQEKDNLRENH